VNVRVSYQLLYGQIQHRPGRAQLAMLVVVKGNSGLDKSLQEGLLVAGLLEPDLLNGVVAIVELFLIEELDPFQKLIPLIQHGGTISQPITGFKGSEVSG